MKTEGFTPTKSVHPNKNIEKRIWRATWSSSKSLLARPSRLFEISDQSHSKTTLRATKGPGSEQILRHWDFQVHRIYHTYRERAKRTLRCSIGANLRESDLDNHNFTCLDCLQGANDRDVRRTHFNPTSSKKEDDFPPGTAVSMDVADSA